MKKYFYPFVFGVLVVNGCGKDPEAPLVLSGIYQSGTTSLVATPIRMYTKNGEVNNPPMLDHFLYRHFRSWGPFSRIDIPSGTRVFTLTVRSNKRATLTNTNVAPGDSVQAEVLVQKPTSFVLANLDSVDVLSAGGASTRCDRLDELIGNTHRGKRCTAVPATTGYGFNCRIRPVRLITIEGRQLVIPQFNYVIIAGYPAANSCEVVRAEEWNTFNPAILNQLVTGDTIVVQEQEIPLTKK
jgi:hypothetical protein